MGLLSLLDAGLLWFMGVTFMSTTLIEANPREETFSVLFRILFGLLMISRASYLYRK